MKKILLNILIVIGLSLLLLSLPSPTQAKIVNEENAIIQKTQTIDDDLFITGESVRVSGRVKGDVYAAGGRVVIDGNVNGDVLAAGGTINVGGRVGGSVRAAGGIINIDKAIIGGGLTTLGGDVNISPTAKINGGAVVGAGNYILDGSVTHGLTGGAGQMIINGLVGKDIHVGAGSLQLGKNAKISGNLIYSSQQKLLVDNTAVIGGTTRQIIPQEQILRQTSHRARFWGQLGLHFWSYLSSLLIGLILIKFFPKQINAVEQNIRQRTWASFGWGLAGMFLTAPALLLISLTIIGIPLAVLLLLLFLIEVYLSKIFVGLALGNYLNTRLDFKGKNPYLIYLGGLTVLYILLMAPILRFIIYPTTLLLGLGAVILAEKDYFLLGNKKKSG